MNRYSVILAAGKGSRMKSRDENISKVSYQILGKPLVRYVLDAIKPLDLTQTVVVVGFGGKTTTSIVQDRAEVVWQHELLGTGHALMQAEPVLGTKEGTTIVLCGDTPLLKTETLERLFKKHESSNAAMTILTAVLENPKGYGRIIRDRTNGVVAIREDKDCSTEESLVAEINSGVYIFNNELLFKYLKNIKNNNAQNEYYLTDLVDLFVKDGLKVDALIVEDAEEMFGINDRLQLSYAAKVLKKRINKQLMLSGVTIEDPNTTYISPDVIIGRDTTICPNTTILGSSEIGEGNIIGPNAYLKDAYVGDDNKVTLSHIVDSTIGSSNVVGPYARIAENTVVTNYCNVGNFVELRNTTLEQGVTISNLSYLGNTKVGNKSTVKGLTSTNGEDGNTIIGQNVVLSEGTIVVSPINVGDNSITPQNTVVDQDIKEVKTKKEGK